MTKGRQFSLALVLVAVLIGLATALAYLLRDNPAAKARSDNAEVRLAAIDELARSNSRSAAAAIAPLTGDGDARVACRALTAISKFKRPEDASRVRAAAEDPRPEVREAAVAASGAFKPAVDPAFLADIVRKDKSPAVRLAAIRALGALRAREGLLALLDAMEDPSPEIRSAAGVALRKCVLVDYGFRANDPEDKRRAAVANARSDVMQLMGLSPPN